jgi:SNF2 family DNA or RNA helicase
VILDEAQAIKNPSAQSTKAACALNARHRLALTGTPIENRLLDLWSIFAFAMPGVLGTRAAFGRDFDGKDDPLARRRLAARTRPFLLRRTKSEVASDLPDRVEEDLVIELEGTQAALYLAELKRARAQLLKAEKNQELDKLRFNILTSLLRLRQICCHPRLIGLDKVDTVSKGRKKNAPEGPATESAKVSALMELLEQLTEEGQKVLVFSQFVEMLDIIEDEIATREWRSFKLTGATEDRGALVKAFQTHEGPATFLISLKAGGFGLNLTAASYVVLFDPWWNPAVEAQAIDRTHRIGQKQTVFAYRLLIKDSIEEKIRHLQKQKGSLANDILGEENFAQALTLNDFHFLLGADR